MNQSDPFVFSPIKTDQILLGKDHYFYTLLQLLTATLILFLCFSTLYVTIFTIWLMRDFNPMAKNNSHRYLKLHWDTQTRFPVADLILHTTWSNLRRQLYYLGPRTNALTASGHVVRYCAVSVRKKTVWNLTSSEFNFKKPELTNWVNYEKPWERVHQRANQEYLARFRRQSTRLLPEPAQCVNSHWEVNPSQLTHQYLEESNNKHKEISRFACKFPSEVDLLSLISSSLSSNCSLLYSSMASYSNTVSKCRPEFHRLGWRVIYGSTGFDDARRNN